MQACLMRPDGMVPFGGRSGVFGTIGIFVSSHMAASGVWSGLDPSRAGAHEKSVRIFLVILALVAVGVAGLAIYVRVASVDAADWHVDPEEVTPPATPNFVLLAGSTAVQIDAEPSVVAERIDAVAEAEGAVVLAGTTDEGFVTFVVRSRIMGYPDFISLRLVAQDGGTRLHIFSRSRYGQSDLGVNAARVQRWLTAARGE